MFTKTLTALASKMPFHHLDIPEKEMEHIFNTTALIFFQRKIDQQTPHVIGTNRPLNELIPETQLSAITKEAAAEAVQFLTESTVGEVQALLDETRRK